MTWQDIAVAYPEFVQWIVATQGPLPEGEVKQDDYEKFRNLYTNRQ